MDGHLEDLTIRKAGIADADRRQAGFVGMGFAKPDGYFEAMCKRQEEGNLLLLLADLLGHYVGHCRVAWEPDYPHFKEGGIPAIEDLNVLPQYRRKGIASRLLQQRVCQTR